MKSISVVIPSYKSWAFIGKCLEALDRELSRDQDEVIVVDSSGQAAPDELRRKFARVQWELRPQRLYPGAARNIGFQKSRHDWIAFVDSDVVVQEGWRLAIEQFPGHLAAGGGPVDPGNPETRWGSARYWIEFGQFHAANLPHAAWNIPSCNMLWKRSEFENTGGFPEDCRSADDLLFNYRNMKLRGRCYTLAPQMRVTHPASGDRVAARLHLRQVGYWSGRARRQGVKPAIPASMVMLPLLFLYRYARVCRRYIRGSRSGNEQSLLWLIAKGTLWWCLGFFEGMRSAESASMPEPRE
ncbi:MAG TPA: glycosyltransferase [Acidobacteriota bacterium]|jgi:glycosyltransferase involved in cell wall biosynthesis